MAHLDRREGRKGAPICGLATAGSILYGVFNNGKMELIPTRHVGPESRGEVPGDRPRDAMPDRAPVEFRDGDDFRGGTGEKDFIRRVEIVAIHRQLFDSVSGIAGELDDRVARDAA